MAASRAVRVPMEIPALQCSAEEVAQAVMPLAALTMAATLYGAVPEVDQAAVRPQLRLTITAGRQADRTFLASAAGHLALLQEPVEVKLSVVVLAEAEAEAQHTRQLLVPEARAVVPEEEEVVVALLSMALQPELEELEELEKYG